MDLGLSPLGLLFLSLGSACAIFAAFLTFQQIGQINRKLPEDEQIGYWWGHPSKSLRIKQEYRRLYPAGRIEIVKSALTVAMFIFLMALLLVQMRFFNRAAGR